MAFKKCHNYWVWFFWTGLGWALSTNECYLLCIREHFLLYFLDWLKYYSHFHLIADGACKKYPPDAKARFGRAFQSKLSVLLLSENQISGAQLQAMYDEVVLGANYSFRFIFSVYNQKSFSFWAVTFSSVTSEL